MTNMLAITGSDVVDRARDPRAPMVRLVRLLDPDSVVVLAGGGACGVLAVHGTVHGLPVLAFSTDPTRMGGALGAAESACIVMAIDAAVRDGSPVIGLWQSGGAHLADGAESLDGVGQVFAAMTRASGRVPQVSVVLGPAAGAAAYGPALTDIVIMAPAGRVFVTGPEVVRRATGQQVDMDVLGGGEVHGRRSGLAHLVAGTEDGAYLHARRVTTLLADRRQVDPDALRAEVDLRALLPESPRRAYDVRPVVHELLDGDPDHAHGYCELQPRWATNITVGLGRLGGGTVGVVANNPLFKGGCLDSLSAEKAARFVRMCDAFGVPMVVLVDVPGYLPGVDQEWSGVVRRGAKLLHAFAEAVVPRVTLMTRKSYGGAYIAMNSRSLGATKVGATAVLAWPEAAVAVMSAEVAVGVLHRRQIAAAPADQLAAVQADLVREHERVAGGLTRALAIGAVDEVIDPADTRYRVACALASAPATRGRHGNVPL